MLPENLHPGEPTFTLRAQDKNAPEEVWAWIRKYIRDPAVTDAQFKKATEAIKIAVAMEHWQQMNPHLVKLPD